MPNPTNNTRIMLAIVFYAAYVIPRVDQLGIVT